MEQLDRIENYNTLKRYMEYNAFEVVTQLDQPGTIEQIQEIREIQRIKIHSSSRTNKKSKPIQHIQEIQRVRTHWTI